MKREWILLVCVAALQTNVHALSALSAQAIEQATNSRVLSAEGVKAANAAIGTSELIEENEKVVNEIYLSTVGKDVDTFTSDQVTALFDVASQCPMLGGNAVFKARTLYWLIDDTYDFDDALICLPYGIIVKSMAASELNAVAVVPNPAMDAATLVLSKQLDSPGIFVVFDAIGAEVMRHTVPSETPRSSFSTASLASALYHYQVRGPSGIIGEGKLAIVR